MGYLAVLSTKAVGDWLHMLAKMPQHPTSSTQSKKQGWGTGLSQGSSRECSTRMASGTEIVGPGVSAKLAPGTLLTS